MKKYFVLSTAALLLSTGSLFAQVAFVRSNNGATNVRIAKPDGTGEATLNLNLPKPALPTWSHDGVLLGITATDPAHPAQISLNAFSINVATGATQQVTHFLDNGGDTYTIAFAFYKAFSPDRSTMAVNSYLRSGSDSSSSTTPILQLFPTNGDPGPTATLHIGNARDEVHHDGEGVDWSPKENFIVAPFKWDAPLVSGQQNVYGFGEATALYLINAANGAAVRLTTPRADVIQSGGFVTGTWAEEDYAPKFSPNGSQIAFVRSYQEASPSGPKFDIQSLHIIDLATGNDRQVISFQQGLYVSQVDWSPDGTQLVFDLGQQANSSGFPIQFVNPATDAVYLVGTDGSNPHPILNAPSGTPAWRAGATARPALLANVSTRMGVGAGANSLIGGFIVTGFEPKKVIIRGMGPSLAAVGVPNTLADPYLELNQGNKVIVSNDNWQQAPNKSEIPKGFAPSDSRESVIVATLNPGSYTAVLRGAHGETGTGIVEAYDLSGFTSSVANVSTRGRVNTGDDVMIGGFFVGNGGAAHAVVRAMGPSLTAFGVPNALQNPTLDFRNSNGAQIGFNDDWQSDAHANQVQANGLAPKDSRESAIFASLAPGSYTAIVRGKNNTTGVALVEIYNVQ